MRGRSCVRLSRIYSLIRLSWGAEVSVRSRGNFYFWNNWLNIYYFNLLVGVDSERFSVQLLRTKLESSSLFRMMDESILIEFLYIRDF
jgi:hypothetical protein